MEQGNEIAFILGELRGEVRKGFEGVDERFDAMEEKIKEQGGIIEELQAQGNQRLGKAGLIGAASGVAFSLLGAFISGGWFHR